MIDTIQMYLSQAANYGDTALERSSNGTLGLAKYYILMMKISYNRILLNEKRKRKLEREIVKTAEKYRVRDTNIMKDIENIIQILAVGDEN